MDTDNSIRSLARDTSLSRMREFAVPPCTRAFAQPVFALGTHNHWPQARKRWVQAGGRVVGGSLRLLPEGVPLRSGDAAWPVSLFIPPETAFLF